MKRLLLPVLLITFYCANLSAQVPSLTQLADDMDNMADSLSKVLPLSSVQGITFSEANTGSFPAFSVGIAPQTSMIDAYSIFNLINQLGVDTGSVSDWPVLPFPGLSVTGKTGIPFLPIDVGVSLSYMPGGVIAFEKAKLKQVFNLGLQARFKLLDVPLLPGISAGLGYFFASGGLEASVGNNITIAGVTIGAPKIDFSWNSHVLDAVFQVDYELLFLRPFIGAGISYSLSTNTSYSISADSTITGLAAAAGIKISDTEITYENDITGNFTPRVFLGTGLSVIPFTTMDLVFFANLSEPENITRTFGANITFRASFL